MIIKGGRLAAIEIMGGHLFFTERYKIELERLHSS